MLHPATAHFAVVLPIISLVLGLAYLIKPSELMSKISTRFMVFATLFLIAAFFSGKNDAGDVFPLLSDAGQDVLRAHKDLALYLVLGMGAATIVKFYGCFKQILRIEMFGVFLVAILSAGVLYQAKIGGELTYQYGANVAQYSDGMDCIEEQAELAEE